ncbi:thiamine diphosphokinase [Bacillus niameyensis]|uniref:thiamine diphosphokinase n=1 Tax=Bacillus niameyensis TaxID=1522308 RepID=UPI000784898A|nr:thiamine diphosphokinase [Bacillus niameyensis]
MSKKKTIHIVAGGPETLIPNLASYKGEDIIWVGVDRGVYYLLKRAIIPTLSVGDFDSVTSDEWEKIQQYVPEINRFIPEKDESDMELALMWTMKQSPSLVRVFGATGGRMDHFLTNIFMLTNYQTSNSLTIEIIDIQNEMMIFYPGVHKVSRSIEKKYISFIPLSAEVASLNLSGFKYVLTDRNIKFGTSLCISNELIQETGTFSFEKGILMMIRSTD